VQQRNSTEINRNTCKLLLNNYPYRIALRLCPRPFSSPPSYLPRIASTGKGPTMFAFQNVLLFTFILPSDSWDKWCRRSLSLWTPSCSTIGSSTPREVATLLSWWPVVNMSLLRTPALLGNQQITHAANKQQILVLIVMLQLLANLQQQTTLKYY